MLDYIFDPGSKHVTADNLFITLSFIVFVCTKYQESVYILFTIALQHFGPCCKSSGVGLEVLITRFTFGDKLCYIYNLSSLNLLVRDSGKLIEHNYYPLKIMSLAKPYM